MTSEAMPNPEDFSVDLRDGEYRVVIDVTGELSVTIKAENLADAERKAEKICADCYEHMQLDEVTEAVIDRVYKTRPMFRVIEDGKKMQVSRLEPGMTPRAPDERGF